jgi:hypothetical protein
LVTLVTEADFAQYAIKLEVAEMSTVEIRHSFGSFISNATSAEGSVFNVW